MSEPSESSDSPASSTGLRPRPAAMLPTTKSEIMLNAKAMPTLVPARPSWPERFLAATAPTVALSGKAALTKTWEPASRSVEVAISRGTMTSVVTRVACRT